MNFTHSNPEEHPLPFLEGIVSPRLSILLQNARALVTAVLAGLLAGIALVFVRKEQRRQRRRKERPTKIIRRAAFTGDQRRARRHAKTDRKPASPVLRCISKASTIAVALLDLCSTKLLHYLQVCPNEDESDDESVSMELGVPNSTCEKEMLLSSKDRRSSGSVEREARRDPITRKEHKRCSMEERKQQPSKYSKYNTRWSGNVSHKPKNTKPKKRPANVSGPKKEKTRSVREPGKEGILSDPSGSGGSSVSQPLSALPHSDKEEEKETAAAAGGGGGGRGRTISTSTDHHEHDSRPHKSSRYRKNIPVSRRLLSPQKKNDDILAARVASEGEAEAAGPRQGPKRSKTTLEGSFREPPSKTEKKLLQRMGWKADVEDDEPLSAQEVLAWKRRWSDFNSAKRSTIRKVVGLPADATLEEVIVKLIRLEKPEAHL